MERNPCLQRSDVMSGGMLDTIQVSCVFLSDSDELSRYIEVTCTQSLSVGVR